MIEFFGGFSQTSKNGKISFFPCDGTFTINPEVRNIMGQGKLYISLNLLTSNSKKLEK